jgi:L-malate glycosyltransferase
MTKPRILIIENSVAVTGALKSILRSSMYLREWYDFVFILPKTSEGTDMIKSQGFECLTVSMKEIRKNVFALMIYWPTLFINLLRLRRIIRRHEIDLVVNNDFYNLLPAAYKFSGGKIPYVCYVRFLPSKFPQVLVNFWTRLHLRYASKVIAVSNAVKRELPVQENVVVIGNELPQLEEFAFKASTSSLILYPSNYIRGKGHQYALESFSKIHNKYPHWRLRFVGGDMGLDKNKLFKESLMSLARQLGIHEKVEWLGFTTDMVSQYCQASIVLNFSDSESFSLTVLEGMYYGRAVVATDCGGPSEIIDHPETGIIVPLRNVDRMAEAIEFFIADETVRTDTARNAYKRIREKFSNQQVTELLKHTYEQSMRNKNSNF